MTKPIIEDPMWSKYISDKSLFYDFIFSTKEAQEKSEVDYYNEILNLLLDIDIKKKKIQIKKRMIEISEILNIPSPYEMKKDFD